MCGIIIDVEEDERERRSWEKSPECECMVVDTRLYMFLSLLRGLHVYSNLTVDQKGHPYWWTLKILKFSAVFLSTTVHSHSQQA